MPHIFRNKCKINVIEYGENIPNASVMDEIKQALAERLGSFKRALKDKNAG